MFLYDFKINNAWNSIVKYGKLLSDTHSNIYLSSNFLQIKPILKKSNPI